ncbi:SubName: Full=Uncharacterized protein {ECO:0000313/EMBL:CCA72586.1} [Serendipita indica DSM 11827]|uniref:Helicase C-terminal domain-containing protein n=1 Tax=Serendipita indica (strain DSM 11827) TaxID=1109443 RepID=G4TMP6_SERID|nr:SubName: Full=Uncharacterized protein {ECO:0000313/EMBL:CCA72586.1} [Serendipita indica DSM 11827]CCA72586.1 hypothetical protein PIIN_06523 [Serendipita indica DSM 11827]
MPPKSTSRFQTSLSNWFKSNKKPGSVDVNTLTDDDDESRTLPPPSEPDSTAAIDGEDDDIVSNARPTRGKGTAQLSELGTEDDDQPRPKKKLLLAPEADAKGKKARVNKKKASTAPAKVTKGKRKLAAREKAKKKATGDEDVSETEDGSEDEDEGDKINRSKAHPEDLNLPPLSTMPAIFRDIVARNPKLKDVVTLFQTHTDRAGEPRKLRVGTMCSGTESPLLALQLISEAMELNDAMRGQRLDVEHIFSCEIEPFKQAYIERNFRPPILFRDVTELGRDEATTAYGSLVPVPGNIDLLVAGTSCVDYSTLNVHQKSIDAGGESGNTFYGMLSYVKNHRPPIVILENVCGAPWDKVCGEFEDIGYRARFLRLDTKFFYIPHTRTRVYMIAIEARRIKAKATNVSVDDLVEEWVEGMKSHMQRPASCTLDAFLLPNDDPRIHEGRQRLAIETKTSANRRRKEVDWARCEQRHTRARAEEALGNKRPLTRWEEGGGFNFLDYIWEDWCADAVPRVKDLMDISHLRAAKLGVDTSYKTTVWNLSQNVDRQIGSGRLGIAPCLTPTMIAYITNRGGPLVGIEALGLQGLPVDRLLLTRETQDQLADLAGNAMSTTVVGSAIILALVVSIPVLEKTIEERDGAVDQPDERSELAVDRLLYTETLDDRIMGLEELETHPLQLSAISDLSWHDLLEGSVRAKRWCRCEGRSAITDRQMHECSACGATSCVKCGQRPEHMYRLVMFPNGRPQPVKFAEEAKKALPMALSFLATPTIKDLNALRAQSGEIDPALWASWVQATVDALHMPLHFVDLRRQDIWVAIYESPTARLELHLHPKRPEWRLFAIPDAKLAANSPIRRMLVTPISRMICQGDVLAGRWEYAVPGQCSISILIQGVSSGENALTDSWEKSLGLLDSKFVNKLVWKELLIQAVDHAGKPIGSCPFDRDISGTYRYLPSCGTACHSLHKRIRNVNGDRVDDSQPDLYFFLDPRRTREGSCDSFVFSTSPRRYEYSECRPIIARLNPEWRQSDRQETKAECSVDWTWIISKTLLCTSMSSRDAFYNCPCGDLEIAADVKACAKATAILTCSVPLGDEPGELWPMNQWFEIDKLREREYLKLLSWILERVRNISHDGTWKEIRLAKEFEDPQFRCERCAPRPPRIVWYKKERGHINDIRAIEDPRQAGPFERALKARPPAFQIHVKYDMSDKRGRVVIGVNPVTLIHQAIAYLPPRDGCIDAAWRLDTSYVPLPLISTPDFVIPSNRHDEPAAQPEGFKLKLRPEQLRSLRWMQQQEDSPVLFVEEEICEDASENLGWRIEGRARRSVSIRGGVVADQVGYGKTAIMLGLIATRNAKKLAKQSDAPKGKIMAKGTCVIVPAHLVLQWKGEVTKFIRSIGKESAKVVTLLQGNDINSTTIEDIQSADIVIVASTMPNSEHYWDNLGSFAGVALPSKAGRYFNARLEQAHAALSKQVELLQADKGPEKVLKVIQNAHANVNNQEQFVQLKRLKGKAYADAHEERGRLLKKLASEKETEQVVAVPMKVMKSLPKRELACPETVLDKPEGDKIIRPTRIFLGVFPPIIYGINNRNLSKSRGRLQRKPIIIDSDSDDAPKQGKRYLGTKDDSEGDYKYHSHSESDDETDFEDSEESSSAEEIFLSDESDVVRRKPPKVIKNPPKPKAVEKSPGKKRKNEGDENDGPPAKKAKVVKPKKSRATMDPWKLSDKAIRENWTQMRAPPLDMFHFHRLVIDEFTYTKKEHVSHAIVTRLSASCRWVMSGTPPTGNFASVKGIAAFLGIHLGVDDDAEGATEEVKSRIQDKTAAEAFHSFREVRSAYWHTARHTIAQRFLDQFNLAEIDDIPLEEKICAVTLTASERALYLELEHYLRAQELKMKKTGKSQSDRVRRLNKALGESKTPEEALLKSASHFDCQTVDILNSTVACDIIVKQRQDELDKCKRELRRRLIKAFKMERRLRSSKVVRDTGGRSHFRQTLDEWEHGGDKDSETKEILASLVKEARNPDAEADSDSSTDGEPSTAIKRGSKKTTKEDEDKMNDTDLVWAHREHAHELRALAKELGGRVRSLRFFQCVRSFQGDANLLSDCPVCGKTGLGMSDVSILSSCGHVGCHSCVAKSAANEACIQQSSGGCKVPASALFVVRADTLGYDRKADAKGKHWGQKLEDIVALIKSLPCDERVLLFVQFPDLTKKVAEALANGDLSYSEIKGTPMQQSRVLQDFQDPKSKCRILLLNLGDESASGGNLTVANHAIFISPLLAKNQFEYTQAETQAIGRIRRFGQTKIANIYRFVTRSTIDEEIYTTRGQTLGDLSKKVQICRVIGHTLEDEDYANAMDVDE